MKAVVSIVFAGLLGLAPMAKAVTPLDLGGKAAMGVGGGLIAWDITRVVLSGRTLEKAQKQLASSQNYKAFAESMVELRKANEALAAAKAVDPNVQTGSALDRIVQAEGVRDKLVKKVLEDDILRFDPLAEGRALPAGVEESRAKVVQDLEDAGVGKFSRLKIGGGIGLLVGGAVLIYMTGSDSHSGLVSAAEAYDGISPEGREEVALEVEDLGRAAKHWNMGRFLDEYRQQ